MKLRKVVMVSMLVTSASAFAVDSCDMTKAMQAAQTAERQRRNDDIDARVQQIRSANDAYNECLDNFPGYPTDLPNNALFLKAYQTIKKNSCQALISKAQQVGQQINTSIENKTGQVGQEIDKALGSAGLTRSDVSKGIDDYQKAREEAAKALDKSNTTRSSPGFIDSMRNLFQ